MKSYDARDLLSFPTGNMGRIGDFYNLSLSNGTNLSPASEEALALARSIERAGGRVSKGNINKSLRIGFFPKSARTSADVFIKNGMTRTEALLNARNLENAGSPLVSRTAVDASLGIGRGIKSAKDSAQVFMNNGFAPIKSAKDSAQVFIDNGFGPITKEAAKAPKAPFLKKARFAGKRALAWAKGKITPAVQKGSDAMKTTVGKTKDAAKGIAKAPWAQKVAGFGKSAGNFVKSHKVAAAVVAGIAAIGAICAVSEKNRKPGAKINPNSLDVIKPCY